MAEETQNVSIACNATGRPSPRITWSTLVGRLAGDGIKARDGTLKIYNFTRKEGGMYICKAESILGSATDTAQLMVFSSGSQSVLHRKWLLSLVQLSVCHVRLKVTWILQHTGERKESLGFRWTPMFFWMEHWFFRPSRKLCKANNALTTREAKVKFSDS